MDKDAKLLHVSYICEVCNKQRYLLIDKTVHLNRGELKNNGLATYIDIHTVPLTQNEHGVIVAIDEHFIVRSNSSIDTNFKKVTSSIPFPGIQSEQNFKIYNYPYDANCWKNLIMISYFDSFKIIMENTNFTGNWANVEYKSPMETSKIEIQYITDKINNEYLKRLGDWILLLLKWSELTADVNSTILPYLFKYIDRALTKPPTILDELTLSILLDKNAKIRLREHIELSESKLFKYNDNEQASAIYEVTGIDLEIYRKIIDMLDNENIINIPTIIQRFEDEGNTNISLDTFLFTIFDLMQNDQLEYQVSYLM